MQIAIALAIDLGLDRDVQQSKEQEIVNERAGGLDRTEGLHIPEARRAYIGCYYLSVLYSLWF